MRGKIKSKGLFKFSSSRLRDEQGRSIEGVDTGTRAEKDTNNSMNTFGRILRTIFDWNFFTSLIRFLTGQILTRTTTTSLSGSKSTLFLIWSYIANFISKFIGWSIVITLIVSLLQVIYQILPRISPFFNLTNPTKLRHHYYNHFGALLRNPHYFLTGVHPRCRGGASPGWWGASAQPPWWDISWVKFVLFLVASAPSILIIRKLWLGLLVGHIH